MKSILKSMRRNIKDIGKESMAIIEGGSNDNKINNQLCDIKDGKCNSVKLKSVDLRTKEKNIILDNITNNYAKDRKKDLISVIDANLAEHPEQSSQLKSIIEEWADLKIEAFENRRSWVRASGKNN